MSHTQPATVARELLWAATELAAHDIANPRLDAEVLLAHSLGTHRAGLYTRLHAALSLPQLEAFQHLLHRRLQREPLQYITGVQEFWSLEFAVDPRVLIPRPETELVVETALRLLPPASRLPSPIPIHMLDIGTGSGCLAIALTTELPNSETRATDISSDALAVAAINAHRHNVHQRIRFLQGDLFAPVADQGHLFELIVSNPPYIARHDLLTLQLEVRNWEPRNALDGGEDGLNFYRHLLREAPHYLSPNGWLVMEIGAGQDAVIMPLLRENEGFTGSFCTPDYEGRGRVVAARKK